MKAGVKTRQMGVDLFDAVEMAKMNAKSQKQILVSSSYLSSSLHRPHKTPFRLGIGHNKTGGTFYTRRQPFRDQNQRHKLNT